MFNFQACINFVRNIRILLSLPPNLNTIIHYDMTHDNLSIILIIITNSLLT
ncbi:hypothetical protein Lalb_Chr02g0142621 [Lupinus albus]|uniref:Uncharacterized protein n=1 Tax=Lupinus albus TaxID=3870 RepID=A0A6A4QUA4_LUPAL|nr:hypothetical protein Lalb_Chr02g0142621 [Lupinus albus]